MLTYPQIEPVLYSIPLQQLTAGLLPNLPIRWYSLAYVISIILVFCGIYSVQKKHSVLSKPLLEDAINLSSLGLIIGGRLFYVIIYQPSYFLHDRWAIAKIWEGGMSFHGGCIGAILGVYWASRKHNTHFMQLTDAAAIFTPIGLLLGRIANFINAELFGRKTDSYLGMIFPTDPTQVPRHPSQLYEAATEGILLFIIMIVCYRRGGLRVRGLLSSVFLIGYAIMRFAIEFFREPDPEIGLFFGTITMGQILSMLMLVIGIVVFRHAKRYGNT